MTHSIITAAILVIGDEILSGRTKDKNIGYIAEYLTNIGIDLKEVRVVADEEDEIVAAVNALRGRYTYVFTTGGIGPTHDDITADCVAKAFGVSIDVDPRARALLLTRIAEKDMNEARLRMARIPMGADLILNKVSAAPGFRIGNVHVMAGVPSIFQAMLDAAPDAMIGVNSDGIIVMANAQTEVVFGYEPDSLLGEPIEVWNHRARNAGMGDYQRETLTKMFQAYARDELKGNANVLGWLLKRPPTSLAAFAARMATHA
jgi:molybdenum cofactor synthesis domain-containing protein